MLVIESWLHERIAKVVVGGACSTDLRLVNMIFQGIVLGLVLWNYLYADAHVAVHSVDFKDFFC